MVFTQAPHAPLGVQQPGKEEYGRAMAGQLWSIAPGLCVATHLPVPVGGGEMNPHLSSSLQHDSNVASGVTTRCEQRSPPQTRALPASPTTLPSTVAPPAAPASPLVAEVEGEGSPLELHAAASARQA